LQAQNFTVPGFRTLYCMHQIYGMDITDQHCSTTDSVGLAREHRLSGAHSCSLNSLVTIS